ncbi:uncharacterized protein [Littorina saxatilis]|uniref:uncharacterized protein n=1 Tax=Littorina saxatilis TaxID=31220 RepID=UPI0038B5CF0B
MGHTVTPCITSATGNPQTEIKTCTLPHVTCKDSGTYKCETEGPDTVTKSVQLTVKGPPEISGAKQHNNDETTTLMFTVCSHTMDFTKCFLSPQSPVTTDKSSLLQTTDVSSYPSWETCSRLNWTLAGEPPQLNMSVEVQGILFGEGSKWEVTLENALGEGRSEFIIHSPHGNGNGATTERVDYTPTESQSLLSNTIFVTLISNASVVGVIVLLVIAIVVTRRGRRARCLHENMRLQERRPPLLPQRLPQPAQIPHNHQERLQATAASSLGCSTQRPHSESSESDIYDKAREDEDECAIGAACTSMLQKTDCAAQGNGATNVPANIDIATNLPDDYLHAI